MWRVEFNKYNWASNYITSINRLVEIYRNYRQLETAQNSRDQLSSNTVNFKGKSINGALKNEAPKAFTTPTLITQKKDTLTCYYREVYQFQDYPYINKLA